MEERTEILEMLKERWYNYYDNYIFYRDSYECPGSDRLTNKYCDLINELTHIIARVEEQPFAEVYKNLSTNFKIMKELRGEL